MKSVTQLCALSLIALAACTASDGEQAPAEEAELVPGFHPPAAASGELRIVAPMLYELPAGKDITYCTYIENPFGREVDVVQSLGFQSKFGHHALGSSRVDLQACKLEYSIVSPK